MGGNRNVRHPLGIAVLLLALAGCSDPLDRVDRLSEVPLDETAEERGVTADADDAPPTGILAALFGRARPEPAAAESEDAREASEAVIEATGDDATRPDRPTADLPEEVAPTAPVAEAPRRGLFGLFRRAPAARASGAEPVQLAAASGTAALPAARTAPRRGPDARDLAEGDQVAFGEVARLCGVRAAKLGKEIGRFPERGGRYRLYDSFPASTSPRPFYITGFKDGCARQFTAALAMFGSPTMHEQLRYGLPAEQTPYSDTDKGYEKVKARVCRVSARKPCGSAMSRLERTTAFVSYYESFGGAARWANILLHDGAVVAADIKTK